MAISEISSPGVAAYETTGSTAVAITHGLSIQPGDIVVAFIHANAFTQDSQTITDNNGSYGFNAANGGGYYDNGDYGNNSTVVDRVAWRKAGSSEPASYAWTLAASQTWTVHIRVFRGCDQSSPWDVAPSAATATDSLDTLGVTATSIDLTTATAGALALAFVGTDSSNQSFSGQTNSYANELEVTAAASVYACASYTRACPSAGAVGTMSVTLSVSNDWQVILGVLRPPFIGTVTSGLVAEYAGRAAKSYHVPGGNSPATSVWKDLAGTSDATLGSYAYIPASGWDGNGSAENPYCLRSDQTSTSENVQVDNYAPFNFGANPFAVEMWVYYDSFEADCRYSVKKGAVGGAKGFRLGVGSTGIPTMLMGGTSGYSERTIGSAISLGAWHHMIATFGIGVTGTLYVDGATYGTADFTGVTGSMDDTTILEMMGQLASMSATMRLATVRIYNRALSDSEAAQNYNAGILALASDPPVVARSGLVAEYVGKLAKGSGTFGNASTTGENGGNQINFISLSRFDIAEGAVVSKLTAYYSNGASACNIKGLIYSGGPSDTTPNDVLAATPGVAVASNIGAAWRDFVFSSPVTLSPGTYWLGFVGDGGSLDFVPVRNLATGTGFVSTNAAGNYTSPPNNPTGTSSTRNYCVYATYTTNAPGNNTDPTSTWQDLVGGNGGTLSTGFAYTAASGWVGSGTISDPYGLKFDDVDTTVDCGDFFADTDYAGLAVTLETWFSCPTSASESNVIVCLGRSTNATGAPSVALYTNTARHLSGMVRNDADVITTQSSGTTDDDGTTHHAVITASGGTMRVYLDGAELGTGMNFTGQFTFDKLLIGARTSNPMALYYNGVVCAQRAYSRALTLAEIQQNYAAGITATSGQDLSSLIALGVF